MSWPKKEIITDIKSIDSTGNMYIYNTMNAILQTWYSKNKIKSMNNDNHLRLLSDLIDIVYLIDNHLTSNEAPKYS